MNDTHGVVQVNVLTTPMQARSVLYLESHAKELGFRVEFSAGFIILHAIDRGKFKRLVPDADLHRVASVEEANAWLSGFSSGWNFSGFCKPKKKGAKK